MLTIQDTNTNLSANIASPIDGSTIAMLQVNLSARGGLNIGLNFEKEGDLKANRDLIIEDFTNLVDKIISQNLKDFPGVDAEQDSVPHEVDPGMTITPEEEAQGQTVEPTL